MANAAMGRLRALTLFFCLIFAGLAACGLSSSTASARVAKKPGAPLALDRARTRYRGHYRRPRRVYVRRKRVVRPVHAAPTRSPAPTEAAAPPQPQSDVVRLAAEQAEGTDARAASDIAAALAGDGVKVMPVLAPDSLATVKALPQSADVDLAFVRSDVLDQVKSADADAPRTIGYVARLFDEEISILARPGVADVGQLDGKKVGIDVPGSSDWVTGRNIFNKLGLHPQFVEEDLGSALAALDKGQLDAVVVVDGKPAPLLFAPRAQGVHILPIPYDAPLQDQYYPARLTHADYPQLISGPPVDTVAVATMLVAPMDPSDAARQARIANFAQVFLSHFESLLGAGRYPKWGDVNLAADAPGWDRIPAAKQWLDAAEEQEEKQFDAFVAARAQPMPSSAAAKDKLFQEFVKWNNTRAP